MAAWCGQKVLFVLFFRPFRPQELIDPCEVSAGVYVQRLALPSPLLYISSFLSSAPFHMREMYRLSDRPY